MRREKLCLKFAKACVNNHKLSDMFPRAEKNHLMEKRRKEVFLVKMARTERYKDSAVPFLQGLLNKENLEKRKSLKRLFKDESPIVAKRLRGN